MDAPRAEKRLNAEGAGDPKSGGLSTQSLGGAEIARCLRLLDAYEIAKRTYPGQAPDLVRAHDNVQTIARYLAEALNGLAVVDVSRLKDYEPSLLFALESSATERSTFYSAPLAIAILHVLEVVGSGPSLPLVGPLVGGPEAAKPQQAVVFAVIKAREAIAARISFDAARRSLLRPAEAPPSDNLLHGAGFAENTDSSMLLRPAQPCVTPSDT